MRAAASARPATERRRGDARARIAPRGAEASEQVAQIQRARLLAGAVGAIEEHGYPHTTVAQITHRARVSRRTFYQLFDDREACLQALIEDALALVQHEIEQQGLAGLPWRERVRGGLAAILSLCDREPALARVCLVHSPQGGPRILALRERTAARLAAVLDEGRHERARATEVTALTAEGLVGAALGILAARLGAPPAQRRPLADLHGDLMGMIVLPYLGPAAARGEQTRSAHARSASPPGAPPHELRRPSPASGDPLQGVPIRMTYRTARVLEVIAGDPGVSNRLVAERAGISDQGQISKLLARLQRLGLTQNTGDGHARGEPNAWSLTALGGEVALRLRPSAHRAREAA